MFRPRSVGWRADELAETKFFQTAIDTVTFIKRAQIGIILSMEKEKPPMDTDFGAGLIWNLSCHSNATAVFMFFVVFFNSKFSLSCDQVIRAHDDDPLPWSCDLQLHNRFEVSSAAYFKYFNGGIHYGWRGMHFLY